MPRAALALPLAIAAISFAPILVRFSLPAPPVVIGFYRMALAAAVLVVILAVRRHRVVWGGRAGWAAVAAGAAFGSDLALWNNALAITPVAVATLLVNLTPLHVGLWFWLRGHPPDRSFVAGAALAIAGCALLLGLPAIPVGTAGPLLALGASFFYAAYLVCVAAARREIDVLSAFTLVTLSAAAVLGLYALALGLPFAGFPTRSWAAMAGLALVTQVGGVFGVVWCMRYLTATFASVALVGQPALAALLGWWLLAEPLGPWQLVGGAGVLGGILLAARSRR